MLRQTKHFLATLICTVMIAAAMILPGEVFAEETAASNSVTVSAKSNVLNGFVKINGYYYFYKNGVRVPEGWYMIGGKKTYLHAGGKAVPGWFYYSGQKFYLSMKGEVYRGFHNLNGKRYYFDDGGRTLKGWQTVSGKHYYMCADGSVMRGLVIIDGARFYMDPTYGYALNRWQTVNGKHYYLSSYGKIYTGWQTIDGERYYFNPTYGLAHSGWQILNGSRYYLSSYGQAARGWKTIGNQLYYFDPTYGSVYTGIRSINGVRYYFNSYGVPYTGVHYVNGVKYTCASDGRIISSVNVGVYRAAIIGESHYSNGTTPGNHSAPAMACVCRESGYSRVQYSVDATRNQIFNLIDTTFAGADSNDVSLFYFFGHGSKDGWLSMTNGDHIHVSELAERLNRVPGHIVVILGNCFSGYAINKSSDDADSTPDFAAINSEIISAFAGYTMESDDSGVISKSGELANSKFYVLTACSMTEESWNVLYKDNSYKYLDYDCFTRALVEGAGYDYYTGKKQTTAPADTDYNHALTLQECYKYSASKAKQYAMSVGEKQNAQVYPYNSSFRLFRHD